MGIKNREEIDTIYKWNLEDMFKDKEEFELKYSSVNSLLDKVVSYKGHIMDSSESLYNFYKDNEALERVLYKVLIYAHLLCDTDTTNKDYQELKMRVDKLSEDVSCALSFINTEMLMKDYNEVLNFIKKFQKF